MFTISNQADYGLIILSTLYKKKNITTLAELVYETKLPKRFIARIAAILANNKFLKSKEGRGGGYLINTQVKSFSLFDYLRVFEKDIKFSKCSGNHYHCKYKNICQHQEFLSDKLNLMITEQLKKTRLVNIFN